MDLNDQLDCEESTAAAARHKRKADAVSRSSPCREEEQMPSFPHSKLQRVMSTLHSEVSSAQARLFGGNPEPTQFQRIVVTETDEETCIDTVHACQLLHRCMELRKKWLNKHETSLPSEFSSREPVVTVVPATDKHRAEMRYEVFERTQLSLDSTEYSYSMVNGVVEVCRVGKDTVICPFFSFQDFLDDFNTVREAINNGPMKSYSYKHLKMLEGKFDFHILLNAERETEVSKRVPHRDFHNVRKVDTHVHHSACMTQRHLLRFIIDKLDENSDEIVYKDASGVEMTIAQVFKSLNLTAFDLSLNTLDMTANNTFHRFDRFNLKYNPAGQSKLREVFLKTDNRMGGKYVADITREVMNDLQSSKYTLVEWRVSIYGRASDEWSKLAKWFYRHRMAHEKVRWLIQVPRLFDSYCKSETISNFEELLANLFLPLFEATLHPGDNPELDLFLDTIVGFDSVDDESRPEFGHLSSGHGALPPPQQWTTANNPPYGYWLYYMYSNICVLNQLRSSRGMSTFQFRPHCGEAGDPEHLISSYLLAHQVNHGLLLRKLPGLHFLYYLSQVGIAMSPLSNNKLFLEYDKSPFYKYFKQGLNVSLSSDDPLMLHFTNDPLVEEYSIATQVWKFSATDQCEIARNSVLQSGFEEIYKKHFLGGDYCDILQTNVPNIRLSYRQDTLQDMMDKISTRVTR